MAINISSWLKGCPEQPLNTYVTDKDEITGLVDSMDLDAAIADEEMYSEKYWRLRKAVDEDEICNNLRAEKECLRKDNTELEGTLLALENTKISMEVRVMRLEKELEDIKAHNTERSVDKARNEALKLENAMLKKNEGYLTSLLLSYDIQMPALTSPPTPPLTTPDLTDDSDMDDANELEDPPTVCLEWYNHGKCSRGGGSGSNKCKRGAHPLLVNFSTPLRPQSLMDG